MKKPSRFLRLVGAAGLLATLLAGVFSTPLVSAGVDPDPQDDPELSDIWDGTNGELLLNEGGIFFARVSNDDEYTGLGPADTSVTVMNLTNEPAITFAFVGDPDDVLGDGGGWTQVGPFFLNPFASKTFTAAELGIAEGTSAPVHFSGYNELRGTTSCELSLGGPLNNGIDANNNGECDDVEVFIGGPNDDPADPALCVVDDANGDRTNNYQGVAGGTGGLNNDNDCIDAEQGDQVVDVEDFAVLGGVAKQAVDGETLPYTTTADTSVSGYNAHGGVEVRSVARREEDRWTIPIAQTNGGPGGVWNTILTVANFGQSLDDDESIDPDDFIGASAVTLRFFPYESGEGSVNTGFQLQALLDAGEFWTVDLSDYVPEGEIYVVEVLSDSATMVIADRVKLGYSMWITNSGSNQPHTANFNVPGASGQYLLLAPDVRLNFYGWNTGINFANLHDDSNNVNVQYFNALGNAPQSLTQRLEANGGGYIYAPSQLPQDNSVQDPSSDVLADIIGSGLIWSDYPVAAVVDATKFPESTDSEDINIFQGFSYSATANTYNWQFAPLVQRGNAANGLGATSGINVMNPNAVAATVTVWWVNPSGFDADNFGTSILGVPAYANGFVYTMTQQNLPNGFYGSAIVHSTYPISGITTQVDYQVEYDGTASWNLYNPCGFYRDQGEEDACFFGDPFLQPQGGSVKVVVEDEFGDPAEGVWVALVDVDAPELQDHVQENPQDNVYATGLTDTNGEVIWTNIPEGHYEAFITDGPNNSQDTEIYDIPVDPIASFTLNTGEDIEISWTLEYLRAVKWVDVGWSDVEVCLWTADDEGELDEIVDCVLSSDDYDLDDDGVNDEGGALFEGLDAGWYIVTVNGGYEFPIDFGMETVIGEAEFFDWGEIWWNRIHIEETDEGTLQKVLILPDFLCEGPITPGLAGVGDSCPNLEISGVITFFGPDGEMEVEGNVQTFFLGDDFGPEGTIAFALTDFNVPQGGPYTINELLDITYDLDGPGGDDPVTIPYDRFLETAEDGQVVCDDYLDATVDCEASPDDPEIWVYENQTTRVFNDLTDIVTGQLDVFIRDDEADLPIEGGEVCLYDGDGVLVGCALTDIDGQAEFLGVPAGLYQVTAEADGHEIDGSGLFLYLPVVDALNFGMDDELGDEIGGLNEDIEMALDPIAAILGVEVMEPVPVPLQGPPPGQPSADTEVRVYLADPNDVPGEPCQSATLVAVGTTDVDGFVEFAVSNDIAYCVAAGDFPMFLGNGLQGIPFFDSESPVEAGVYMAGPTPFDDFDPEGDIDVELFLEPLFEPPI